MRIRFKGKEEEVDNILNKIIILFKYLNSKNVFITQSNKSMIDRLINNKSISINYKKYFISKLRQEQGNNYVNRMTGMINDLNESKKENVLYKQYTTNKDVNEIIYKVEIINQSVLDINKDMIEKIQLQKYYHCLEESKNFYLKRHDMRKLIWCLGFSKVEIQYLYFKNNNITNS